MVPNNGARGVSRHREDMVALTSRRPRGAEHCTPGRANGCVEGLERAASSWCVNNPARLALSSGDKWEAVKERSLVSWRDERVPWTQA